MKLLRRPHGPIMSKAVLSTIALVIALDRITKHLVERAIALEDTVDVIPGFLRFTHLQNPGSAFSFFAESSSAWRAPALILFSLTALIIIAVLLWRDRETNVKTIALALVFGGALGNLWDRFFNGAVTDFIDFYVGSHHWPPFNIADSAIVVGAVLLGSWMLVPRKEEKGSVGRR